MKLIHIFNIFLLFRIIDFGIIYLSRYLIPYLGFFPYKEIAQQYNLPNILTSLANFDGAHYLLIAKNGYTTFQQAFFPLYPLIIRWLSPIFSNNLLLTALTISNFSFLVGLWIFSKYLREYQISNIKYQNDISKIKYKFKNLITQLLNYPITFLLIFPTSFFFGSVYTEGLFFFLLISTFYFLKKERLYLAAIFAFLASLTKLIGVFLIIPIIFYILHKLKAKRRFNHFIKLLITDYRLLIALISPILGLTAYSLYLWQTTGDPLFFLNSQWAFGAHRTSGIIFLPQVYYRYLHIFFTANFNFQYFISLFEFFTFNFVFIIVILNLFQDLKSSFWGEASLQGESEDSSRGTSQNDKIGLGIFSIINLLLPTLTGTFSSIPRYALFSLSFFIYLAQIKNLAIKLTLAIIFVVLHIIMFGFFSQGYFVS